MKKVFLLLFTSLLLSSNSKASVHILEAYNPDSTAAKIPIHWTWLKSVAKPSRAAMVKASIQESYNQLVEMVGIVEIEESWVVDTEHGPAILFKYYSDNFITENIVAIYIIQPSYNYHDVPGVI